MERRMNRILLILQEHAETAAETAHQPNLFGLNAGTSFWTLIIFGLLFLVLLKFAFPPILGYAAAREQRIQQTLDEARRHREEAARLLEQQRQELAAARQQAQALLAEGKQMAERAREELLAKTRADQQELLARAQQDIARERDRAIESLRREAVDLALAAATRLLRERVDAPADRKLVTDYLSTAGDGGARGAGTA
jgi:F-type H+-transporting ATPase subunit b